MTKSETLASAPYSRRATASTLLRFAAWNSESESVAFTLEAWNGAVGVTLPVRPDCVVEEDEPELEVEVGVSWTLPATTLESPAAAAMAAAQTTKAAKILTRLPPRSEPASVPSIPRGSSISLVQPVRTRPRGYQAVPSPGAASAVPGGISRGQRRRRHHGAIVAA